MSGLNLCFLFLPPEKRRHSLGICRCGRWRSWRAERALRTERPKHRRKKKNIAGDRDGWVQNRSKSACVVVRRFTTPPEGQPEQQRGPLLEVGWMPSRDTRKLTLCRIDCKQQSASTVLLFDSRRADNSLGTMKLGCCLVCSIVRRQSHGLDNGRRWQSFSNEEATFTYVEIHSCLHSKVPTWMWSQGSTASHSRWQFHRSALITVLRSNRSFLPSHLTRRLVFFFGLPDLLIINTFVASTALGLYWV